MPRKPPRKTTAGRWGKKGYLANKTAATRIQTAYRNRRKNRAIVQPFTETKKMIDGVQSNVLSSSTAFNCIQMVTYLYRKQGMAEGEMVGDSVYGRYLGVKMRFQFPPHDNAIDIPTTLHCYFITVFPGANWTKYTNPTQGAATKTQLEEHIENQLKEFYDTKQNRLQFNDRLSGFRIDKHVQVKPDRNTQIGRPQSSLGGGATTGSGAPPDVFINYSWDIKQKLHYEEATGTQLGSDTHYLNRPGQAGYKCCVVYNPDFAGQDATAERKITLDHNHAFWFGDS